MTISVPLLPKFFLSYCTKKTFWLNIKRYGDISYPYNHHAIFLNLIEAVKGPAEAKISNAKNCFQKVQ